MNENRFLIAYGLHCFVRHNRHGDKSVFSISSAESPKMVSHAASLIFGHFGNAVDVHVM